MGIRLDRNSFDLQGECPICRGQNLDYDSAQIDDLCVYYDWECQDCHSKGTEWYTMDFYSQAVDYDGKQKKDTHDDDWEWIEV
jgi:hypothetical protein